MENLVLLVLTAVKNIMPDNQPNRQIGRRTDRRTSNVIRTLQINSNKNKEIYVSEHVMRLYDHNITLISSINSYRNSYLLNTRDKEFQYLVYNSTFCK